MVEPLNMTYSGMSMTSSLTPGVLLWFVGLASAIIILLLLWTLFTKFRYFITGAVVTTVLVIVYNISKSIGRDASTGNWIPFQMLWYVAGFVIISTMIGYVIIRKTKLGKKIENFFMVDKE